MKYVASTWHALTLLFAALATAPAGAAPTAPPTAAPAQSTARPTREEIDGALNALRGADENRLMNDRDYATQTLRHLDLFATLDLGGEGAAALDTIRLLALIGAERRDEALALVDRVIARRPTDPGEYYGPWIAALAFEDNARALTVIESAARRVPGVGWPALRASLTRESAQFLFSKLSAAHDEPGRVRFAAALYRIGYPGNDAEYSDLLRSILRDDRLSAGDRAGAAGYAAGISTPTRLLSMLVQTKYDPLLARDIDRLAVLGQSLDARDRETAEALAAAPTSLKKLLDRAQFLRATARERDAFALLEPATRDIAATLAADSEYGMWVINEAAYALVQLGRNDDAVRLMDRLAALPMADNPNLISARINHLEILWHTGRFAESLDRATRLEAEGGQFSSVFGKMWIASARACALAHLNRGPEAAPQIALMRANSEVNASALMLAYLCVGDEEAAAALMIRRLESDDPEDAILALQDYRLSRGDAQVGGHYDQLVALRQRPAVRAALDRVGRVLTLPLSRAYWGTF